MIRMIKQQRFGVEDEMTGINAGGRNNFGLFESVPGMSAADTTREVTDREGKAWMRERCQHPL